MIEGSILKQLADAHRTGEPGKRPLNFGVYYKNTLVALCHALEDSILESDCNPLMITAFQRGKWYLQEADRYGAIAQNAEHIVIMATPDGKCGEHPTSQKDNVALVSLSTSDPVSNEWHLIIVSPTYTAMVLCQELSEEDYRVMGPPQSDLERKFYGFWTFEPRLVVETAQLAIAKVQEYDPALADQLTQQLQPIDDGMETAGEIPGLPSVVRVDRIVARVVDYLQHSLESGAPMSLGSAYVAEHGKRLDKNLVSNELQAFLRVAQLMDQADVKNSMAGAEVAALAEAMGQLLDLPGWQLHRLRLAGLLHRLGLLQSSDTVLISSGVPESNQHESEGPACPLVLGTQVLRTMPRLRAIATIITHQTEWWNGEGTPAKLSGDAIPLESRILGLVADFQYHLAQLHPETSGHERFNGEFNPDTLQQALSKCAAQSGERWDPKLVEVLTLLVSGFRQGLSLSVTVPKIAAGLWLLDDHEETVIQLSV